MAVVFAGEFAEQAGDGEVLVLGFPDGQVSCGVSHDPLMGVRLAVRDGQVTAVAVAGSGAQRARPVVPDVA